MLAPMPAAPSPWIALVACPRCKGALDPTPDGGRLVCAPCLVSFPIDDGLPRLRPSDGTPTAR